MFGSISKIAQSSLGSISKVRDLMDFNPLASGLVFPPQVSLGLAVAGTVGDAFGIKVPNEKELIGLATGQLNKVLGDIKAPVDKLLGDLESTIGGIDSRIAGITNNETLNKLKGLAPDEVLDKIEWLL